MTCKEFFENIVEQVKKANYYYNGTFLKEVEGQVIEFYNVGHNASHCFAIGLTADGRLAKYSSGEGFCGCEEECDCIQPIEENIKIYSESGLKGIGSGQGRPD